MVKEINYQVNKCLTCCWAKMHDNLIFCPFAEDTCMKYDQVFKNLKYRRNKECDNKQTSNNERRNA